MRSKRQRIFIFVLFSVTLGLALSTVVLITASSWIHSKQLKQIQLVEQFTYSNLGDNAKLLSKQLRAAVELEFLTITDNNGNVLYRFIQPEYNYHLITPILKKLSMYTKPVSIITSNGHLHIEFHSSYSEFLRLFTGLLFFMFFAPTVILAINRVIRVRAPIKAKIEIENDEIKDKLTGLPTGPIFIQEFELLAHANKNSSNTEASDNKTTSKGKQNKSKKGSPKKNAKKKSSSKINAAKNNTGYFVLIRATQLQYLNFNLGYPAGDKYIQLIALTISTQVLKDPTLKAFKLNGFDFGMILPNYSTEQCDRVISELSAQFSASFLELDVSSKLGFAALPYNNTTNLTTLLSQADGEADKLQV